MAGVLSPHHQIQEGRRIELFSTSAGFQQIQHLIQKSLLHIKKR